MVIYFAYGSRIIATEYVCFELQYVFDYCILVLRTNDCLYVGSLVLAHALAP